jgi:D-alanine transaminase
MSRIAYVNGEFVPLEKASVSILDRGFLFADGIYEVTAVIDGRMVDNDLHLKRLARSVGEIDLVLPETPERIEGIQTELMRRNNLGEGVIYLQVTRGAADRDFAFPRAIKPTLVMFTQTKNLVDSPAAAKGLKVVTCPDIRWARRDIKSVGLLAQVLARQMAAAAGCQEAWMLDGEMVTEGSSSTAYIITQDGVIVTRPRSTATLPGCTRIALERLTTHKKLKLEERAFSLAEALAAREAFVTSASSLVTAVVEIDGKSIGDGKPGPLASELRRLYIECAKDPAS